MSRAIVIEGEPYLALETVAEEFRVDLVVPRSARATTGSARTGSTARTSTRAAPAAGR